MAVRIAICFLVLFMLSTSTDLQEMCLPYVSHSRTAYWNANHFIYGFVDADFRCS